MSLASQFLFGALVVAAMSVFVAQRHDPLPSLSAMTRAVFALFWLTVVALVVHSITRSIDFFGVVHVFYLAIVVSLPLTSFSLFLIGWARLRPTKRRLANLNYMLLFLGMLPAAFGYYATHIEPDRLQVDTQTILLSDVAAPIRIAVLSDLQTPNVGQHELDAVAAVIASEPDLIVIPGDFWAGDFEHFQKIRSDLAALLDDMLASTHHVVMVVGDTDGGDELRSLAEETGAVYLADDIWRHDVAGQMVTIAGTTIPQGERQMVDPDLLAQLNSTPADELTIVVSHRPDAALGLEASVPVDLVIAGHTHGGQVALPMFGPIVTFSDVPRSLAAGGAAVINGRAVYVSSGVGLERGQAPQMRFGVVPEVGLLLLEPA